MEEFLFKISMNNQRIKVPSGTAREVFGVETPPFSDSSGMQALQKVEVYEGEKDHRNYSERALA